MQLQPLNVYLVDINKSTVLDDKGNSLCMVFPDIDYSTQSPNTIIQLTYNKPGRPASSGSTIWKMTKCTAPPAPGINRVPGPALQLWQHLPLNDPMNGLGSGASVIIWEQDKYIPESSLVM